ncbi:hypothetical protein MHYP_G00083300 [Metynnis hypsauchen]
MPLQFLPDPEFGLLAHICGPPVDLQFTCFPRGSCPRVQLNDGVDRDKPQGLGCLARAASQKIVFAVYVGLLHSHQQWLLLCSACQMGSLCRADKAKRTEAALCRKELAGGWRFRVALELRGKTHTAFSPSAPTLGKALHSKTL